MTCRQFLGFSSTLEADDVSCRPVKMSAMPCCPGQTESSNAGLREPVTEGSFTSTTTPTSVPTSDLLSPPGMGMPTSWLNDLGVTEEDPARGLRYCGLSLQDAQDRCAVNNPCPDGRSDNCLAGQTCFPIPSMCMSGDFPNPPIVPGEVTPSVAAPLDTPSPSVKAAFDPTNTQFCGADWYDALDNCYRQRPCPNGTPSECPAGQGCYSGITNCQTPPPSIPAPAASPMQEPTTNLDNGGPDSALIDAVTMAPTRSPVESSFPDWSWEISPVGGGGCSRGTGFFLQLIVVVGAIFGPMLAS